MGVNHDEKDGEEVKTDEIPKQPGKNIESSTPQKEETNCPTMVAEPFSNYSIISKSEKRVRIM